MNREESIALFERCEAARRKALDAGKDALEAHEAAKAVWNGWAEPLIAERKALEKAGKWEAEEGYDHEREIWRTIGGNGEAADFLARAEVNFSSLRFVTRADAEREPQGKESDSDPGDAVKPILCEGQVISLSGYRFPGDAWFGNATFEGDARFGNATFEGVAGFGNATFKGDAWFSDATFKGVAWFSRATFEGDAEFMNATFKGDAWFSDATFKGVAWFGNATFKGDARFSRATFSGVAWFSDATFEGDARFSRATFSGVAWFSDATFKGVAWFSRATFEGDAEFMNATFKGDAGFSDATFSGDAWFSDGTFSGVAGFSRATFSGDAGFGLSTFVRHVTFEDAQFSKKAYFVAISGERAFNLADARFDREVPDFTQAHFAEAPRLDNIEVPKVPFWAGARDGDEASRFQALKRLAIQGHDHVREQEFFAGELRCRRSDHPLRFDLMAIGIGDKVWLFFAGLRREAGWSFPYDFFSAYGRSIWRPLLGLGVSIGLAAWGYWGLSQPSCTEPWWHAFFLSLKNGLLFLGSGQKTEVEAAYQCLYGVGKANGVTSYEGLPAAVGYLGIGQGLVSAVFIFLALLALRNLFKIK